ncbi:MAG TPA: FkbM family methyltransferase [Acidobacteriaceae bacterium]
MGLNRWLRNRARATVDGLFCSSSPAIQRVGDEGSGWVIDTRLKPEICYCAGVGKGISFEVGLAKIASKPVLVFDPSPTATPTIARTDLSNIEFFPIGLAANDGIVEFSVPQDADEGSFSVAREGLDRVSFECWSLQTIMNKRGDRAIDLLKMDIEGFEYDIVDQVLTQKIPVHQLCVEFHAWLRPRQTWKTIWRLRQHGYRLVFKHRGDHTFVMKESRYQSMLSR